MYKLEPVVADGGELIIYAPHVSEVSYTHGKVLDRIGYHVRDYFLKQMDKFKDVPRGVDGPLDARSRHAAPTKTASRSPGSTWSSPPASRRSVRRINLGYMNPAQIKIADYENREAEGVLVVPHAGEILAPAGPWRYSSVRAVAVRKGSLL